MKTLISILLILFASNVMSMDVYVGDVSQQQSCVKKETRETGLFNTPTQVITEQADKRTDVSVTISGDNIDNSETKEHIKFCVKETADNIGIQSMAMNTVELNEQYKRAFTTCLQSRIPTIAISSLFIRTNTLCLWDSGRWAIVYGSDKNISSALDEIKKVEGAKLYSLLGFYRSVKIYENSQSALIDLPRIRDISYQRDAYLVNLNEWCQNAELKTDQNQEYYQCNDN